MFMLVVVEVLLVLLPATYPPPTPPKVILAKEGIMGGLRHLSVSAQHPPWRNHLLRIIQLVLWMVLILVLVMDMVKVVWVLGPLNLSPRKLIVGFMVIILCFQQLGKIHS